MKKLSGLATKTPAALPPPPLAKEVRRKGWKAVPLYSAADALP